jgi:VWFA-related protein
MKKLCLLLLLVLLVLPHIATAQVEQHQTTLTFEGAVEVQVVNLDVYVRDRRGRPVMGLGREDFTVYENGAPRPVTNFQVITIDDDDAIDRTRPNRRAALQPEKVNFVILIDAQRLLPFDRNRVVRSVSRFLQDQVSGISSYMIVTFDGSLQVRQPLTDDFKEAISVLKQIEGESTGGLARLARLQSARDQMNDVRRGRLAADIRETIARNYASEQALEVSQAITAFKALVSSLAGLDGRTAVLFVSPGLPIMAGEEFFRNLGTSESLLAAQAYDQSQLLEELVADANAAGVTFYTVQAKGLHNPVFFDASRRHRPARNSTAARKATSASRDQSLAHLAASTGGVAVFNKNFPFDAIKDLSRDFSSYYSIAYEPKNWSSKEERRIEVKVDRPKTKVRHRRSFRVKTDDEIMSDRLVAVLHHVTHPDSRGVEAALPQMPVLVDRNTQLVPVVLQVPLRYLVLVPDENGLSGELQVHVMAKDDQQRLSPMTTTVHQVKTIPAALAADVSWTLDTGLHVRPGSGTAAFGIRDRFGDFKAVIVFDFPPATDVHESS